MSRHRVALSALSALCLGACATPQVALDQANQGVSLVSQLELHLQEFRRVESVAEQAQLASLAEQDADSSVNRQELSFNNRARQAASATRENRIIENMTAMIQGYAEDEAAADADRSAYNDRLSTLLDPLPSTTASTTAVQSSLADMGKELPWATRRDELKKVADTVRKNVDDNRKKIHDAQAAAAARPKQ